MRAIGDERYLIRVHACKDVPKDVPMELVSLSALSERLDDDGGPLYEFFETEAHLLAWKEWTAEPSKPAVVKLVRS